MVFRSPPHPRVIVRQLIDEHELADPDPRIARERNGVCALYRVCGEVGRGCEHGWITPPHIENCEVPIRFAIGLDQPGAPIARSQLPRAGAAQCTVGGPEVQTAAVDVEGTSAQLNHLSGWTGIESTLDRRRVVERASARRERAVYRRPVGNAAHGIESRIPRRYPVRWNDAFLLRRCVCALRERAILREKALAVRRVIVGETGDRHECARDNKWRAHYEEKCPTQARDRLHG